MKIISLGPNRRATAGEIASTVAIGIFVVVVLTLPFPSKKSPPLPAEQTSKNSPAPAEHPQWTVIHTDPIMKSSYTFVSYQEFPPVAFPAPGGVPVRFFLRGRFASDDKAAKLIVIDPENYARWLKREPFFPLTAFAPMQPINLQVKPMPGFVVVDPPPETPELDLSSIGSALLSFVKMRAAQQPKESHATIELTLVAEAYVTPSQAKGIIGNKQK